MIVPVNNMWLVFTPVSYTHLAWDKSPTSLVLIIKILSFCLFLRFFFTAYQMPHCKCRMIQKHPRSGKSHNLPNLLPHLRLVAMHLTVRTECFLFHKGTFLASESGIIRKLSLIHIYHCATYQGAFSYAIQILLTHFTFLEKVLYLFMV